jgi:hypothetical protein
VAKAASSIKTNAVPEGGYHGHLSYVIPEAEYQLEIEDNTHEFEEKEQPATYPTMTGDDEDWEQKQKVAEHLVVEEATRNIYGCKNGFAEKSRRPLTQRGLQSSRNPAVDMRA